MTSRKREYRRFTLNCICGSTVFTYIAKLPPEQPIYVCKDCGEICLASDAGLELVGELIEI